MNIIVIHELDLEDNERLIVGVADSIQSAESMIAQYYGSDPEVVRIDDLQEYDDGSLYSKTLEISKGFGGGDTYRVKVTLEQFTLNSIYW